MNEKKAKQQKVLYAELTPGEFKSRMADAPIAYLLLGTLEWHDEHLPLGSEGIRPSEFFQEHAAEVGGIVLPTLYLGPDRMEEIEGVEYYGKDNGNHPDLIQQQYVRRIITGSTYWISDSLYLSIIESILKQLKRQGFKILVAHGHGPSTHQIIKHTPLWVEKYGFRIFHLWGLEDGDWSGFMLDHGAMLETSVVMKYLPDLVQLENFSNDPEAWPVGVRGYDPHIYVSAEIGEEIVKSRWIE